MTRGSLGLLLLFAGMLRTGSGLSCYKCADYTGACETVQQCITEDACISLSEKGGRTVRQCIRYTDCSNLVLSRMFPSFSGFSYRCCNTDLCNSGNTVAKATPVLTLLGLLLGVWWCWI